MMTKRNLRIPVPCCVILSVLSPSALATQSGRIIGWGRQLAGANLSIGFINSMELLGMGEFDDVTGGTSYSYFAKKRGIAG